MNRTSRLLLHLCTTFFVAWYWDISYCFSEEALLFLAHFTWNTMTLETAPKCSSIRFMGSEVSPEFYWYPKCYHCSTNVLSTYIVTRFADHHLVVMSVKFNSCYRVSFVCNNGAFAVHLYVLGFRKVGLCRMLTLEGWYKGIRDRSLVMTGGDRSQMTFCELFYEQRGAEKNWRWLVTNEWLRARRS